MENYLSWGLGRTTDSVLQRAAKPTRVSVYDASCSNGATTLTVSLFYQHHHHHHLIPLRSKRDSPHSSLPTFPSTRSLRSMPAALPTNHPRSATATTNAIITRSSRFRAWLCPCARIKLASWYSVVDDGTTAVATATTTPKRSPS